MLLRISDSQLVNMNNVELISYGKNMVIYFTNGHHIDLSEAESKGLASRLEVLSGIKLERAVNDETA